MQSNTFTVHSAVIRDYTVTVLFKSLISTVVISLVVFLHFVMVIFIYLYLFSSVLPYVT